MRSLYVLCIFFCLCSALLAGLTVSVNAAALPRPTINLATNISAAFSADAVAGYEENLLPHLSCILEQMQRPYSVQTMPWRRAYQEVKNNRIDGFFTAIPMRQVDPYAVLSSPMVLENWYWFWRSDTIAPESWRAGSKLGSILGSQQETWLAEAGYKVEMSGNNLPQLIKLLQSKRIDVILADREHFLQAAKELKVNPKHFQSRFFRYVPLGVYFNEQFLNQNPGFLAQFNSHTTHCSSISFAVSEFEKNHIKKSLGRKIERWKHLPGLEPALLSANKKMTTMTRQNIEELDEKWVRAFATNDFSFSVDLINQSLSAELREIKKQSREMVTEIIVTDKRGLNVAISDMTSDYWQGDEAKFTRAYDKPANSLIFGDINYDESTKRFQLHLSVPLHATQTHAPLGVMIFGVDVEKVLAQPQ